MATPSHAAIYAKESSENASTGTVRSRERRHGLPTIGSMCTGYGGLDLAAHAVYGGELRWCADNDPHATMLLHRRFPGVPNIGDLTTVDWTQVPAVDIVTAGFPCQDISYAGRGAGIKKGTRSGLWYVIADALRLLRPGLVLLENVAALRTRGLAQVLGDLAALGYDTTWCCLRASDIGAPHRRERVFITAAHPANTRITRTDLARGAEGTRAPGEPVRRGVRPAATDPLSLQRQRQRTSPLLAGTGRPATTEPGHAAEHRRTSPTNTAGQRQRLSRTTSRNQLQPQVGDGAAPTRLRGAVDNAEAPAPCIARAVQWGQYGPAVDRWEAILGRPAPQPTETGTRGQPRLNARFVEWMMGLPSGWVTDIPITRTAHMRLLGNGVVPQQAAHALRLLAMARHRDGSMAEGRTS
jgi:DNA (cytosine-5)-methyltransferase 1